MTDSLWTIEMFGSLRVTRDAQVCTRFRTRKTGALLACLAYHRDRTFRRDELVELLWPNAALEAGRNGLRVALHSLRHDLEPSGCTPAPLIVADRMDVSLNPSLYTTDKDRFERLLKAAHRTHDEREKVETLRQAVSLYRGDLLPGYEEVWTTGERQRLADEFRQMLRRIVRLLAGLHDIHGSLGYARRAVQADPLHEPSHRDLMQLHAALGRPGEALCQYREVTELLRVELGVDPAEQTRQLAARIGSVCPACVPPSSEETEPDSSQELEIAPEDVVAPPEEECSPDTTSAGQSTHPRTEFFGRENEILHLKGRLQAFVQQAPEADTEAALVTLTGLGGSGKTRLALAIAQQMQENLDGAVCFVPLADLTEATLIPDAILTALQLPRQAHADALEQVVSALSHRPALLVLDNFEHLVEEGARLLSDLVARCPQLCCLVTSRQRLNLGGEYEYAVAPLPTPHTPGTPSRLMEFASVQLFVDRARAVKPNFDLDASNASAVGALCHHLEGVPLAIELAAAYVQVMSPAQILARLTPRLKLLVNRQRDAAPRHASLRAALEWSFDLLSPSVQRFFARLSVFRGGWTLEAAEAIFEAEASEDGNRTPNAQRPTPNAFDALECLLQLRERSLLTSEDQAGGMRFGLLETVREFAWEKLSEPERLTATRAHREYHLRVAESSRLLLTGPNAAVQLDLLESEQDNLRAALSYASEDALELLRLTDALWLYWYIRGYGKEGSEWLERAIAGCGDAAPASLRASALMGAGNLAFGRKELDVARGWYEARLALAREVGDAHGEASALGSLGNVGNNTGDFVRARELLTECLGVFERLGDDQGIVLTKANLAVTFKRLGDYTGAVPLHRACVEHFRSVGDAENTALALINMTGTLFRLEDVRGAAASLMEGLALLRSLKDTRTLLFAVSNWIKIAVYHRVYRSAAVMMGALEELRSRTGFPIAPDVLLIYEQERASVLAAVGEEAFASALLQGRGLPVEQVISYALEELQNMEFGIIAAA